MTSRYLFFLFVALAVTTVGLQLNVSNPSGSTAQLTQILSPAAVGSAEPNFSVGPEGRVLLSWLEPADSGFALRFATYEGVGFTPPKTIVSRRDFFVNWADFPSIVSLGNNRLAAHWLQRNGSGTYAYGVRIAQSRDAGATWDAPVTPHRDSTNTEHGFVAMWRDGTQLGTAWLDGRKFNKAGHDATNEMMLVTTTIAANGTRGAEVRLDERTCDCCQNAVAMTNLGPIVAYRNRTPQEIRDIYVTRRVSGRWLAGTPVYTDNWKTAACPVNGPAIAAQGSRVAIAWFTAAGDSARVNVAFSNDAGAKFDAPVRVDAGNPAGRVDLALLPGGDAMVTWIERTGGDTAAVLARRVPPKGAPGAPLTIASSSATRASGFPTLAITGSSALFAWTVPGRPSSVRVARAPLSDLR